jgi:hypothetical protein
MKPHPASRFLRATLFVGLLQLGLRSANGADAVPDGWFLWPSVEPVAGSALDCRSLNLDGTGDLPRISVRDGHFVSPDGRRVRFWGCNLASYEAFPADTVQAGLIARRLAKGGVNLARLHHLDNPWGVGKGGSIWPADHPAHRELDPVQLDRLHRLIATLRDYGIYSNLNLKVSKTLGPADGFPDAVAQIANFQKRVDIFDRRMIELQKDYARRLLATKNPYTGLTPAEDPAVAIVEINNENSLLGYWTRDLGRGLDQLPEPFRGELRGRWNQWLAKRYANDAALAGAWSPPAGAEKSVALIPADARWQFKTAPGSTGSLTAGPDATGLEIHVSASSGIDWHAQASLHNLSLTDGQVYTLEFRAKADHPRHLTIGIGLDGLARPKEGWRSFGLHESVEIGAAWQPVRLSFPAHSVAGAPASLNLDAGQTTGTIAVKELQVRIGCDGAGLQPGQSARAGTVPFPLAPSAAQWADWIHFLADTERAYADEMRHFLKDELHVQALVICSQIEYGGLTGLNREQAMDFADTHGYWQHPDFPGGNWDSANWSIKNTPMLGDFTDRTFGEPGKLALQRVAAKPYTVSEYDHPAPSEFVCEMYPEIAAFACRQDWDAIYPFAIGAYGSDNPDGKIQDYFDQLNHPAKWGLAPFAARVFRRNLIEPASVAAVLHLGSPVWVQQPHADTLWHQLSPEGRLDFLNVRYAVSDHPGAPGAPASLQTPPTTASANPPVRLVTAPLGQVLIIDSSAAAAAVGYLGGATIDAGALRVTCPRFGRDFASVTAVALDNRPLPESTRVLVTLAARASNQGIAWNESRTSLGKNWGHGPTIAERVPATVTLAGLVNCKVYALAPNGTRAKPVTAETEDGTLTFTVQPDDRTMQYEIAAR